MFFSQHLVCKSDSGINNYRRSGIERYRWSQHPPWMPLEPRRTSCEENKDNASNSGRKLKDAVLHGEISPDNPNKAQILKMRRELEEPCKMCMYTGVSVCVGLSLYFVKLATDDTTMLKNRRFLWICSAGSVAVGAYRWYLG